MSSLSLASPPVVSPARSFVDNGEGSFSADPLEEQMRNPPRLRAVDSNEVDFKPQNPRVSESSRNRGSSASGALPTRYKTVDVISTVTENQMDEATRKSQMLTKSRTRFLETTRGSALIDDFYNVSILQQRTHRDVTGIPYCSDCKKFIDDVRHKDRILHAGFMAKKKNFFQRSLYRWFILVDKHLIYYENPDDVGTTFPRGVIHLDGCVVQDKNPEKCEFQIRRHHRKYHMYAHDVSEKRTWMRLIREFDFTFNDVHGVALESGVSHGWFCEDCDHYINLDDFNLAELDGKLEKYKFKKRTWYSRWMTFANNHLAYYESEDDVRNCNPLRVIHVRPDKVRVIDKGQLRPFEFQIRSFNKVSHFAAQNQEELDEWMSVFCPKSDLDHQHEDSE